MAHYSVVLAAALFSVGTLVHCSPQQEAATEPAPQETAPAPAPQEAAAEPAVQGGIPAYVTAAVNDANRPAEQMENDAVRSPAVAVAFSGVGPGDVVVDFRPGGGYYTRILSKVVGAQGKVYAVENAERMEGRPDRDEAVRNIAADPAYSNVTVAHPPLTAMAEIGEPVDAVWLSNNYHDVYNAVGEEQMRAFDQGVFAALKPGGLYFILDHAGAVGTGYSQTDTLHRIEPNAVRAELTSLGFVYDGESYLNRDGDDMTTQASFAMAQFMLRMRKPE